MMMMMIMMMTMTMMMVMVMQREERILLHGEVVSALPPNWTVFC